MRPLPFPPVRIGTDLGEFRSCDSTYCRYDYRSLPRLPSYQFDGTFSWLRAHPSPLAYDERFAKSWGKEVIANWKAEAKRVQPEFSIAARDCAATIPDAFMSFLFDADIIWQDWPPKYRRRFQQWLRDRPEKRRSGKSTTE